MKINKIIKNTGFAAISFLIFLLLLEILLRMGVAIVSERFTKVDPWLGWYHEPNSSKKNEVEGHAFRLGYNGHGFRLPEHDFKKTRGVFRIVVLGDSFVDGSEVGDDETFTWHLQQQMEALEVINLGVYGFSTAQELITLERVGLRYHPDLVVLVTMTNDYTDNLLNISSFGPRPRYLVKNDSLVLEGTAQPSAQTIFRAINLPIPGRKFFHQHSYLYYAINHYLYQRLITDRINSIVLEQKRSLDKEGQMKLYYRLVERMKNICENDGIDFLVVFAYPEKYLLENQGSPSSEIAKELGRRGINTLDLFNRLREEAFKSNTTLYYIEDFHWNPQGHKFVAVVLKEWIESWTNGQSEQNPIF